MTDRMVEFKKRGNEPHHFYSVFAKSHGTNRPPRLIGYMVRTDYAKKLVDGGAEPEWACVIRWNAGEELKYYTGSSESDLQQIIRRAARAVEKMDSLDCDVRGRGESLPTGG